MPVYSMTGYASAQQARLPLALRSRGPRPKIAGWAWKSSSVNSRFLDLSFRLPDDLRALEPTLRSLLTARLKRGKVEVRAAIENEDSNTLQDPPARLLQRLNTLQTPSGVATRRCTAERGRCAAPVRQRQYQFARLERSRACAGRRSPHSAAVRPRTRRQPFGRHGVGPRQTTARWPSKRCRWCRNWSSNNASASWSAGRKPWPSPMAPSCPKPPATAH